MKKNLLLVLFFAGFAASTQAQNTYVNITNNNTISNDSCFVTPHHDSFKLLKTEARTVTFRIMFPVGTNNTTNWSKIFVKGDTPHKRNYGFITFESDF